MEEIERILAQDPSATSQIENSPGGGAPVVSRAEFDALAARVAALERRSQM